MPIEYAIDTDHRAVLLRAWGHVSSREVEAHHRQLRQDPRFRPDFSGLYDLTDVTSTDYYYARMKALLPDDPWGEHSRRAVVVRSPLIFGLTRTFILLTGNTHGRIAIFHNLDKARRHLDLDLDTEAQLPVHNRCAYA